MYQYILCLSKLPRAWADILLPWSGVLQRGLQYSKVTTGRVCACRRSGMGGQGGGGGIKAVMGRGMRLRELSFCSYVYSTFFHHAHKTDPTPRLTRPTHTAHTTSSLSRMVFVRVSILYILYTHAPNNNCH